VERRFIASGRGDRRPVIDLREPALALETAGQGL
jgi:hypothetical protein